MIKQSTESLEARLNDFDPATRRDALAALVMLQQGAFPVAGDNVNMHCHSFCSFNSAGMSPVRLAWEAKKAGLYAAGLCDFDVLDGMEEFYHAAELIELRAAVHLETRAFWQESAHLEFNSPGEPGVVYIMGCGFCQYPEEGSSQGEELLRLGQAARQRNEDLIARINSRLDRVNVSFRREVLPQSPTGTPTERHIVRAYLSKAEKIVPDAGERAAFWAPLLKTSPAKTKQLLDQPLLLEGAVRDALVKRGGIGYEQPSESQFPALEKFVAWVRDCGAIPTATWLDGSSPGEKDAGKLLDSLMATGCRAINIIPDRNWNVSDSTQRRKKVKSLETMVKEAERRHLPVNTGTEMNRHGQPLADDLNGPVLRRFRDVFLRGAKIMIGQTLLGRFADFSYLGEKAEGEFPDITRRNLFFAAVGGLPPLTRDRANRLRDLGPDRAFKELHDQAVPKLVADAGD